MDGTAEEQRARKVQAGREKLAHFRQRKTKGQSSKTQKKTQKRKGEIVPANDVPPTEDALIRRESAAHPILPADLLSAQVSLECNILDVSDGQSNVSNWETDLEMRLDGAGQSLVDTSQLQPSMEDFSSELLQQELQSAVLGRDEIITQLSSNLQEALLNRKEMEEEALCLSNQIKAIQRQLQDASRVLKRKSLGKKELHDAQKQFAIIHSNLMDQTVKRAQDLERDLEISQKATKEKENEMAKLEKQLEILQEKLDWSESSVSHLQRELSEKNQEVTGLKHGLPLPISTESSLKGGGENVGAFVGAEDSVESLSMLVKDLKEKLTESESLRESLVKKFEKQMEEFEVERLSWEQKHNDVVLSLKEKLNHAEQTVAQEKNEKDRLNQEIHDLKENLRLKEEYRNELNLQQESDSQSCVLKLQSIDKVKLLGTGDEMSTDESKRLILDDSRVDNFRHELEDLKKNLSRVKARKEENYKITKSDEFDKEDGDDMDSPNEPLTLMDRYLIPNQSEVFELSYSTEDIGDHSRFELDSDFVLEHSVDSVVNANMPMFCSPMPITGVLAGGVTLGKDLDPESFAIYLSSNSGLTDEKRQSLMLGENALDRCRVLGEQLQNKEKQLQKCSEDLEEAIAKWRDVTAELAASQLELEKEKANKTSHFEAQQRLIKDLEKERNDLLQKLGQERHLKETHNQLATKDQQVTHLMEENHSLLSKLCAVEKELEKTLELNKNLQHSNNNLTHNLLDIEKARELEQQEFDNKLNFKGLEQQVLQEAIKSKEEDFFKIEASLQEELGLLKRMNEDLQNKLHEMHAHHLDAEAVRLGMTNMHAAQLELSQSNLLKEKENALVQLREALNDKRAQEVALLQNRHQFELLHLQEKHDQELKNLKSEMLQQEELHAREVEQLRMAKNRALEIQEGFRVDIEALKNQLQQSKEELSRKQEQHVHELNPVQDRLQETLTDLERQSKDIELLKIEHAKEVWELQQMHMKERDELTTLCTEQEKQLRSLEETHSKAEELLTQKHSQEIIQQKEQQSEIIKQMRFDFSEEIKQLMEQHNKEKETLEERHSSEAEQWETQKNKYIVELERLQAELSNENLHKQHSEEMNLLKEKCAMEVLHLQEQHFQELKQVQDKLQESIAENERQSKDIELLKVEHAKGVSELQQIHMKERDELTSLCTEQEKQIRSLHDDHSKAGELLTQKHSQEILQQKEQQSEIIKQMKFDFSVEIKQLMEQHNKEKETIKEGHSSEAEQWETQKNGYIVELERLQAELANENLHKQLFEEMSLLKEQCAMEVLHLQEQHDQEISALKESQVLERQEWENNRSLEIKHASEQSGLHQEEMEQITQKFTAKITLLQDLFNKEKEELLAAHNLEKQTWERQQDEHSIKMLQLKDQYQEIEALKNLLLEEKEEWKNAQGVQSEEVKLLKEEFCLKTKELQEQHLKEVKQLQEQHTMEMTEMLEQHILEREEWEKERDLCSQELDLLVNQHSQELKRIGEEISQASLQKQDEYELALDRLQEDCTQKILSLQNQHNQEMAKMREIHAQEQAEWVKRIQAINSDSIHEASQSVKKLEDLHENDLKALIDVHELDKMEWEKWQDEHLNCLNRLVNHHFREVKTYLDEHAEQMEEHAVKILELQEQHQRDVETMQELYAQKKLKLVNGQEDKGSEHDDEHDQPQVDQSDQSIDLSEETPDQWTSMYPVHGKLPVRSSQQIQLLWAQVDSSRASRQELNELKEQLIARSMHLEEIERMKQDFQRQQQQLNAAHEKDLEDLRIYFEQKSLAAEETYRENLELLHQRLRDMTEEGKDDMPALIGSVLALEDSFESEKSDLLLHLTDQLGLQKEELSHVQLESEEKHKQELETLRSLLAIHYEEDLANLKKGLSDKYGLEVESLKRRHSLEMEHLRARLSERHLKELTRMHLENSWEADFPKENATERSLSLEADDPHGEVKAPEQLNNGFRSSSGSLLKCDKTSQTDSAVYTSFEPMSEEGSRANVWESDEQPGQDPQPLILPVPDSLEQAGIKEKLACEMALLTKTVHTERLRVLKVLNEVKSRTRRFLVDNANLQRTLSGESQTSSISKDEAGELISNLLTHNDGLLISDEECKLKPDSSISERYYHLDGDIHFPSHLEDSPKEDLLACLLDLFQRHQDELQYCDLEHKAYVQSLEASHLLKLDSLESSYLSEIQKIRDEHTLAVEELEHCLASRLQDKEKEIQDMLEKARRQQEQELLRLRQDLAAVHLDKFQAMAEELKVAHQDDLQGKLDQQRSQLEHENSLALDALKEEVLRMEESHKLALQELGLMQKMEVQQQTQMLQDELRNLMADLQKHEVVTTELTNQRLVLSSELQEKTSQLLQLQEEIELLKCQSEMLLEQQITQLKEEFVTEKTSAIQELKLNFTRDLEMVHEEKKCLVMEKEEKEGLVLQLRERVSELTKEMEELQSQMEGIAREREKESQEEDQLETILKSEAQIARQEHGRLQESSQRLLKIFTDVLKNTLLTEDLIFKKIGLCLDSSLSQLDEERSKDTLAKSTVHGEGSRLSPECDTITEHSLMSTDEGYEVSEYLCETVLGSLEVGLENEDKIVQMSQRLRSAVERLLDMVSDSTVQLEQTREVQKSFEEEFKSRNQEMAQVVIQNQELQKLLAQETEIKKQLQVELHKAQGLLEGFASEKSSLEEALATKETSEHQLVVELERSQEQVKVLTKEPSALGVEKELLLRLQEVLSGSEKDIKVELLKEVQQLVKEKLELHCQADKDRSNLLSQMRVLEMELEEQMSQNQELMKKTSKMADLQQQIQSLEKQLKHQRHFMDEQAVEREHERDDFQQEIQNLEEQLKQALKSHGDSRSYRDEPSEKNAKDKVDLNLLLEEKKHLEQQIAERNEEMDKMLMRIQELEQAALSNADAAKRCSQLETDLQRAQLAEKELLQDKEALEQQQYNNVLQISALQSKLDETRHRVPVDGEPDALLKKELLAEREALQRKEKEVDSLAEQLELFREELTNKSEEVFQMNMQLEIQRKQSDLAVQHAQEEYLRLNDELSSLKRERAYDKSNASLELPQALLQEKNQEIDHLNKQIQSLHHEAADLEELRSLVEHLRSDQERLRKSKEEEVEQLHEVIEKLQQELEQLGPIRHEVSDSQESLDRLGIEGTVNLQHELSRGAQHFEKVEKESLEEIKSTYETELEALRQQLEEKDSLHITEVEVLETNLHNLQRLNRQHEQAMEFLQETHRNLQEETELLRTHLSQREEAVLSLSDQIQRLQDNLREKNMIITEKELQVQTLQEQNMGDLSDLRDQLAQTVQSLETTKMDLKVAQDALSSRTKELSMTEEKYQEEVTLLQHSLLEWEEKSKKPLLEEVQTQTELDVTDAEAESSLAALKEQLFAAENLAREQKAKLLRKESELSDLNSTIKELSSECDCWKTEAQHVQQQLKKRDACVSELQSHSQNLGLQVKKLQEALVSQEAMISILDLQKPNAEEGSDKQSVQSRTKVDQRSFSESLTDLSAWDSPDMVRKQEERTHSLRMTPFSELSIDHSVAMTSIKLKPTGLGQPPELYNLVGSSTPSLTDSVYSLQHSSQTQRTSPVRESGHTMTDYDSCDDQPSTRGAQTGSEPSKYKTGAASKALLDDVQDLFDLKQKMDPASGEGLSPQLQRMLNMVHEESCKILELSERPIIKAPGTESTELVIQRDVWLKEKQNLQDTIQTLSSALAQAAGKGEKEYSSLDWRRDLLQSVQSLLESERQYIRLELQSQLHHGSGDNGSLSEKVEHLIREQEEQKRLVLEHVLAVDRSSLLSEIQDLRSQLRMAHLQNQEKLQQLQDALSTAEERGNTKEHQLRKQVELYEYKLQQEAAIAEDVKGSLLREQERSSEQHRLLLQEQSTVSQLRSELEELQRDKERMTRLQNELQMEISKLRDELDNKEQAASVLMQTVQSQKEEELKRFSKDQAAIKQELSLKEKSLQEAYLSIEEHRKLNARISSALSQEQTCTSNLRKELEIEQSRCKALLAQEHKKLMEVEQELGRERQHSLSLSSALTLERTVVEQLKQQHSQELSRQDEERQQEHKLVINFKLQLEEERKRSRDLAAMMEQTQQQAVHAKRQLESENQACREEIQKEQEASVKLRALLEALQSQKQQLDSVLDQQREREMRLQKERDQYQSQLLILQEEERVWIKEREKETLRSKQADVTRIREEEQERQIMDLKLQHERDLRRIQELQHMLADLEEQERALAARKSLRRTDTTPPKNYGPLASQMQRVFQQLLHTVLQVKNWVQNKGEGFPDETEVTTLLDSLSELKLELQRGSHQLPAVSSPSVADVLKRENEELATTVSQLTKEKLELRNQLAKLNKSLQETLRKEPKDQMHSEAMDVLEMERAAWNREKRLLQISLKHAESELGKATLENKPVPEVPNAKMQRLYRKYLRAESFRKALVYQKKYLLLLLGGFQACEKATLSLIARMGVYPSPGDLPLPARRQTGLSKFRSAVRAVIAVSRLKFLVRKWQKGSSKGASEPVLQQVQTNRRDVLQHLSGTLLNSPPTRDTYGRQNASITGTPSPKSSHWASRRIGHSPARTPERSPYTTRDPEHSITEYIHHLEMVQRRLGGGPNAPSPELPGVKYARK